MITITVNHNDSEINIQNDQFKQSTDFKVDGSTTEFKLFLIELLNAMDLSEVKLEEINEDIRRTVDEW